MSQSKPELQSPQPNIKLSVTDDYRDGYANSVQVRMSVWDFFLVFGTMSQDTPEEVQLRNFQGVYLSPQQAKASGTYWAIISPSTNRPSAPSRWNLNPLRSKALSTSKRQRSKAKRITGTGTAQHRAMSFALRAHSNIVGPRSKVFRSF